MMRFSAVLGLFPDLAEPELLGWVERGWVRVEGIPPDWAFQEIDVARVRLIRDFRHDLAVPDDTMPLVLSLLDQVYALRGQMRAVASALEGQPDSVRAAVLAALEG
jgi:chaperone modulatory protein CbpM